MSKRTIKPLREYDMEIDELDERTALEESIKIWQYICDHELYEKSRHPDIELIREYRFNCPLCEYYRYLHEGSCKGCPLTFKKSKNKIKSDIPAYIFCYNSNRHPWYSFAKSDRYGVYGASIILRKMKLEYYKRYRETFNPYEDE